MAAAAPGSSPPREGSPEPPAEDAAGSKAGSAAGSTGSAAGSTAGSTGSTAASTGSMAASMGSTAESTAGSMGSTVSTAGSTGSTVSMAGSTGSTAASTGSTVSTAGSTGSTAGSTGSTVSTAESMGSTAGSTAGSTESMAASMGSTAESTVSMAGSTGSTMSTAGLTGSTVSTAGSTGSTAESMGSTARSTESTAESTGSMGSTVSTAGSMGSTAGSTGSTAGSTAGSMESTAESTGSTAESTGSTAASMAGSTESTVGSTESTGSTAESMGSTTESTESTTGSAGSAGSLSPLSPWRRRGGEEDVTAAGWRGRRKHVFVLSEAGKPIYSRHGNEEALAATMGVMMALVSFIQSGGNAIRAICSEDRTLVFEQRGPLLLVSVSRTRQPASQLRRELAFVHEQILSLLTRGGIARVFARRRGYDLRRLLAGAEAVLDRLLTGAASDGRLLLGAARCLPLSPPLRRGISGALRRAAASTVPAPALAILASGGRLVTAARQRALAEDGGLCPSDLHLLLNLLGVGAGAGEVWTPVCLPRFNPDGYFYAYAAALSEDEEGGAGGVSLILLSTEREGFYAAAGCRRRLEEALRAQGWLEELGAALKGGGAGYGPSKPGAPELRHFLYKPLEGPEEMQQLPQFTSPELEEPYGTEEERQRLFDLYHYLHGRVHCPRRPLRLLYHVAEKETLLAWVTAKFELYGCFSPLVTKAGAIGALTKLLRWIRREEDWLFVRYPPPYCATPQPPPRSQEEEG